MSWFNGCSHTPITAGSQEFPTHGQPKDWPETMDWCAGKSAAHPRRGGRFAAAIWWELLQNTLKLKSWKPKNRFSVVIKDGWLGNCNLLGASPLPGVYCQWCSQVFGVRLWVFTGEGSPNLGFTRQTTQIPAQLCNFVLIFKQTSTSKWYKPHSWPHCGCWLERGVVFTLVSCSDFVNFTTLLVYTSNYKAAKFRVWLLMAGASCLICPAVFFVSWLANWGRLEFQSYA